MKQTKIIIVEANNSDIQSAAGVINSTNFILIFKPQIISVNFGIILNINRVRKLYS